MKMSSVRANYKKNLEKIKEFVFPLTRKQKEKRFRQILDVSVFFTSIILFICFEDKLANLLLINPEDVQRISQNQSIRDNRF